MFNNNNNYFMWNYLFFLKTRELAQCIVGKRKTIDFSKLVYVVE